MNKRTGFVAALLLNLAATGASAMNLGDLRVASHLGQPFTGYVEVLASVPESERQISAAVLRDLFASSTAVDVSAFEARIVHEGGRIYVRIASPAPVDTAEFSLRLQVAHDGAALTSRYSVTLTPLVQPATRTRPLKRAARVRVQPTAPSPESAQPQAGEYGPVKPGESLWSIAARARPANLQAFMDEVFTANPAAFVGGDRNRLKVGALLRLPGTAAAPAVAAPAATEAGPAQAPAEPPAPVEAPAAHAPAPDPEFTAMISAFDAKLAAIRAKYGEEKPAATPSPVQEQAAAPAMVAPGSNVTPAPAVAPAPTVRAPAPKVQEPAPAAQPAAPAAAWWTSLPIMEIAIGALILGGLAGVFLASRRALAAKQREQAQRTHSSQEADRKADVARKAENRVKLESEVRQMITKKTEAPAVNPGAATVPAANTVAMEMPDAEGAGSQDRLLAIDANIAHGRYVDAERQLHQVIAENPRNFSAKLRLTEVYYITEQVNGFVETARDLLERHRADISNEEWQRVMRMGKIIAPDAAPFSGVRAIQAASRTP